MTQSGGTAGPAASTAPRPPDAPRRLRVLSDDVLVGEVVTLLLRVHDLPQRAEPAHVLGLSSTKFSRDGPCVSQPLLHGHQGAGCAGPPELAPALPGGVVALLVVLRP